MSPADREQVWATAYAVAFAVTTMGSEILGNRNSPEDIDQRARKLADKASATIIEKIEAAEKASAKRGKP